MDNYRIVTVEGECFNIKQLLNQLEEKIKAYLNEGYVLCGGVSITSFAVSGGNQTRFIASQAVIKH